MRRAIKISALILLMPVVGCKSFTLLEVNYYATPKAEKPAVRVAVPADTLTPVVEVDGERMPHEEFFK